MQSKHLDHSLDVVVVKLVIPLCVELVVGSAANSSNNNRGAAAGQGITQDTAVWQHGSFEVIVDKQPAA